VSGVSASASITDPNALADTGSNVFGVIGAALLALLAGLGALLFTRRSARS